MTGGSPGDVGLDNHQSQSDLLPVNPEIWWTAYPPPPIPLIQRLQISLRQHSDLVYSMFKRFALPDPLSIP